MTVVWEDPPTAKRAWGARERSPQRKEMDSMLDELRTRPGMWARLWDFNDRDEAEKRAGTFRSVAGKGWNVSLRESEYGWSVYARRSDEASEENTERAPAF